MITFFECRKIKHFLIYIKNEFILPYTRIISQVTTTADLVINLKTIYSTEVYLVKNKSIVTQK